MTYGRAAWRPVEPAELLIELAQRFERVGALEARVVCDFVGFEKVA